MTDWLDGQSRRRWLNEKNEQIGNALRYYMGPAAEPVNALAQGAAALSPGADMMDMYQSSGDLMNSKGGWDAAKNAGWLGASALGMALPGNVGMVREAMEEAPKGIRAYHGSPHDFDQFSMDKIGTGEGAQAYGHGLYFADNEGVARAYRDKLSRQVTVAGSPLASHPMDSDIATAQHSIVARVSDGVSPEEAIRQEAAVWREHASMYRDAAAKDPSLAERASQEAASFESVATQIEAQKASDFVKNPGHMYEVNINANPDDFLDWDKPLSAQSAKVREFGGSLPAPHDVEKARLTAKRSVLEKRAARGDTAARAEIPDVDRALANLPSHDPSGNAAYQAYMAKIEDRRPELREKYGEEAWFKSPQELARRELTDAGIPGIRYLDNGSRAEGAGTHNYVVFSDETISILRKYGILGALGAGGYGAMQGEQEPQT